MWVGSIASGTGAQALGQNQEKETRSPIEIMKSLPITHGLTLAFLTVAIAPAVQALTEDESAAILFMKQEEKLARDVYLALGAQWDHPTFEKISASEQKHMNAVDRLIAINGLADTTPAEAGQFTIPELQELYLQLVDLGSGSLTEALQVGVLIEETDIEDLQEALGLTTDPQILRVFNNLLQGSLNHLRAFNAALSGDTTCTGDRASCTRQGTAAGGRGGRNGKAAGQRNQGQSECPGTCESACDGTGNPTTGAHGQRSQTTRGRN